MINDGLTGLIRNSLTFTRLLYLKKIWGKTQKPVNPSYLTLSTISMPTGHQGTPRDTKGHQDTNLEKLHSHKLF